MPTDMAYLKTVTVSSTKPPDPLPYYASYITDGNPATKWRAVGGFPAWFKIDLGSVILIEGYKYYINYSLDHYNFKCTVEVSEDDINWIDACTPQGQCWGGGLSLSLYTSAPLPLPARYIRMTCTGPCPPESADFRCNTFEVYGKNYEKNDFFRFVK